ncbi:winged helix-turn-helix domain-containing protein, partial [Staphylococcus capitis]|nr:winged helix-turn-helix domain-containing protein [Staphylococcus capitis]
MKQRAKASLSGAMADNLARQIEEGVLPAGAKLPSIREYAEASGCSKNTVISAFEMLAADGLIEPRRGSGFFVTRRAAATPDLDEPSSLDRAMDIVWLMREQLHVKPDVLNLGEGFPPI